MLKESCSNNAGHDFVVKYDFCRCACDNSDQIGGLACPETVWETARRGHGHNTMERTKIGNKFGKV